MAEPARLAMFPLSTVLFPGAPLPLHVFEPRYRQMLDDCLAAPSPEFGVVLISRGSEVGGGDQRTDVGTVARVEQVQRTPDGRAAVLARGTRRIRVAQWLPDDPYPRALVEPFDDPGAPGDRAQGPAAPEDALAAVRRVEALASELGQATPSPPEPGTSLWELCGRLPVNALDRQRLLEADGAGARAALLVELAAALADDLERLLAGG